MATPDQRATLHKKGRLELAIQAYQRGEIRSYKKAATTYNVAENTVQYHISRILSKWGSVAKNCLLILTEEKSLVQ
jgi:DNA-binding NarL/FixJ family response regulator